MMPGLKLSDWAAMPLLNIVLLGRDLFKGGADLGPAIVVVATTVLYALAAIGLASRIFGSEDVLYNEQGTWADLWRRPAEPSAMATRSSAMWCLAVMLPIFLMAQGLMTNLGLSPSAQLLVPAGLAVVLFVLWPALVAQRGRVSWS